MQGDSSYLRTIPEDRSDVSSTKQLVLPTISAPARSDAGNSSVVSVPTTTRSVINSNIADIAEDALLEEPTSAPVGSNSSKFWSKQSLMLALGGFCLFAGVIVSIVVVAVRASQAESSDDAFFGGETPAPATRDLVPTTAPTVLPPSSPERNTVAPTFEPFNIFVPPTFAPTRTPLDPLTVQKLDDVLFHFITDPLAFASPSTPQSLARNWMLYEDYLRDDVLNSGTDRILQRFILVELHFSTGFTGMLPDETECAWEGVTCSSDDPRVVQRLTLKNQGLTGHVPSELALLTSLKALALTNNSFTGTIPSLEPCQDLYYLDLSLNQLNGSIPESLWSMPVIRFVYVHLNQLSGSIPTQLDSLAPLLSEVWLQENKLTGRLPEWLSNLPLLSSWSAWDNQFTGQLPAQLPSTIEYFDASFNTISGPLPSTWNQLSALEYLYLDQNQLTGQLQAWTGLDSLSVLWLDNNQLEGEIPGGYGLDWNNLTKLYLFNNTGLTGVLGPTDSTTCNTVWPSLFCMRADVPCACCEVNCGVTA